MNRFLNASITILAVITIFGCEKGKTVENGAPVNLATTADTISYLVGTQIATSLKDIKEEIVLDVIFAGMKDKLADKEPRIPEDQERIIMQAFGMQMQQKQMAKADAQANKNLDEAKKFLEENGKKAGVVTTASGLQYTVLKQGDGPLPNDSSKVKVDYVGTLLNGKEFDSSIKRGQPAIFNINQVIPGWTEALKLMKVGSKYKLFIHPDLGYGRRGMAHDIGPNALLIFEVELLGIEPGETNANAKK
jgi:FKBP-type peptidyl-prolyl cis-trans isomerase FkpA